jgi:hypothetical protein
MSKITKEEFIERAKITVLCIFGIVGAILQPFVCIPIFLFLAWRHHATQEKKDKEKRDAIKRDEYYSKKRVEEEAARIREIEAERKRQAVAEAEREEKKRREKAAQEEKQRREKAAFDEAMRKTKGF